MTEAHREGELAGLADLFAVPLARDKHETAAGWSELCAQAAVQHTAKRLVAPGQIYIAISVGELPLAAEGIRRVVRLPSRPVLPNPPQAVEVAIAAVHQRLRQTCGEVEPVGRRGAVEGCYTFCQINLFECKATLALV